MQYTDVCLLLVYAHSLGGSGALIGALILYTLDNAVHMVVRNGSWWLSVTVRNSDPNTGDLNAAGQISLSCHKY